MEGYLDYLTNNGERYFPYVRVEGIIDVDGSPFSNWIAKMNIHNHDIRYASASHNHDARYALKSHQHTEYADVNHVHPYAGSANAGGPATTALALTNPFTLKVTGACTGSASIKGNAEVSLNLTTNHNHDSSYVKKTGNNTITSTGSNPLKIFASGSGKSKIDFGVDGDVDSASIEYTSGAFKLSYNNVPLTLTPNNVSFNGKVLATMEDLANASMGGGSVDMEVLKQTFASISHKHASTDITGLPVALKNPNALKISMGGHNYDYDGSAEVTMVVDPSALGCAPASHTHDFSNIYAAKNHLHEDEYLSIKGNNTFNAGKITFSRLKGTDFGDDGVAPTTDTTTIRSLSFPLATPVNGINGASIGCRYVYNASSEQVGIDKLYMAIGDYPNNAVSALTLHHNSVRWNNYELLHKGNMGSNSGIDADLLDGKHINELPYLKGTENVITLGDKARSKIEIDTSGTTGTTILVKSSTGYIMQIKVTESSTDVVASITSSDVNMFTLTRDKSTNKVRTDLYGDIYHDGTKVTL